MKKIVWLALVGLALLGATSTVTAQKIERVEPPNWWAGMKNPSIQLLVHGEDISNLDVVIPNELVSIDSVVTTINPNYLFVYVTFDRNIQPGDFNIDFKKDNRLVQSLSYTLQEREVGSAFREGFSPADAMYLITPDRFVNGDPSNDNVNGMLEKANRKFNGGRHGGDIKGVSDKLDYIKKLGFTAIWLNPVLENDMHSFSYHGYAATDFYKVDRRYGSNEEFRKLSKDAKAKGIKMIMDMIHNHAGSEHWFVKDAPTADWINFDGEFVGTTHRRTTNQDIHASEADKKLFSDGWFVRTMPDLNQRNKLMADYLIQNSIWWIEYADLAGIRMDTYPYPDKYFMARWTKEVLDEYPFFNIVGEEWVNNPAIVSYWQKGKMNNDGYVSYLPSLMDFPVQEAIARALNNPEKQYNSGWIDLYETIALDFLYPDPYELVIFGDNHDMDRFYTRLNHDIDHLKIGLAFITTFRGVPQLYYGTEVLMENKGFPGNHSEIRRDMPGGWKGDKINAFTQKGLNKEQKEMQAYVSTLFNWRKTNKAVKEGLFKHFTPENAVYVYFRYTEDGEKVMVVLNKNEEDMQLDISRFAEIIPENVKVFDVLKNKEYTLTNDTKFPAKSPTILEIRN